MPVWPASLPQRPSANGFQMLSPRRALISSQMDAGPNKSRPRSTAQPEPIRMTFRPWNWAKVETLRTFYKQELRMGAIPFTIPHPITGNPITVAFTGEDGHYSVDQIPDSHLFEISLNLEILP